MRLKQIFESIVFNRETRKVDWVDDVSKLPPEKKIVQPQKASVAKHEAPNPDHLDVIVPIWKKNNGRINRDASLGIPFYTTFRYVPKRQDGAKEQSYQLDTLRLLKNKEPVNPDFNFEFESPAVREKILDEAAKHLLEVIKETRAEVVAGPASRHTVITDLLSRLKDDPFVKKHGVRFIDDAFIKTMIVKSPEELTLQDATQFIDEESSAYVTWVAYEMKKQGISKKEAQNEINAQLSKEILTALRRGYRECEGVVLNITEFRNSMSKKLKGFMDLSDDHVDSIINRSKDYRPVIIVDDSLTTGATFAHMVKLLEQRGLPKKSMVGYAIMTSKQALNKDTGED